MSQLCFAKGTASAGGFNSIAFNLVIFFSRQQHVLDMPRNVGA